MNGRKRINCQVLYTESTLRSWPDGDYSLPMSVYGCNELDSTGWKYGYMNMSFKDKVEIRELHNVDVKSSNASLLLDPMGLYSYQLNFCTRVPNQATTTEKAWPQGRYSIFGSYDGCPYGMFCLSI